MPSLKPFDSRKFEEERSGFEGGVEFNASLARFAYYQIGGPASVLLTPKSADDVHWISRQLASTSAPYFILGWGSNILFPDEGFAGVVIRMKSLGTQITRIEEGRLELGASVGGSTLLRQASREGWGGLAHLTGIPGSIGGMVAMNAGTHLGEMKDCLLEVEVVSLASGETRIHSCSTNDFSYRHNHFLQPDDLVTRVWVKYSPSDAKTVQSQIDELYQRRKSTQPVDQPSCGSVFMNPKASGLHAWQVIDQLGLRGHRVGNAQISEKHSNFIVNLGGACAEDVKSLIALIQARAQDELNISLTEEVKIIKPVQSSP